MKRKVLLAVCAAFLSSNALFAQARSTAADPVTGTWTGEMVTTDGASRNVINVAFKLDAKSVLTGTVTGPRLSVGDIKGGTFDPKTGAVKFDVVVRDGGFTVHFDGTLASGVGEGKVSNDNTNGTFKITKQAASAASATYKAAELRVVASDGTAEARRSFTEVSGWVARAAELVPADKYAYRPASTVRTFGQLVAHVADAYNYYCARAAGRDVPWTDPIEKGTTEKAAIVQKLKQSLELCNAAYSGTAKLGPLIENVGHTSLHYGNMITYVRMLGLVPPSS